MRQRRILSGVHPCCLFQASDSPSPSFRHREVARGFWEYLERQTVICVTDRAPESDCSLVCNENLHRQPLGLGPNLSAEQLNSRSANPLTAAITDHKKLPQVNFLRLLSKQSVSDNLTIILEQNRAILTRQPASHALLELRHRHAIPVSFIANQLMVHRR